MMLAVIGRFVMVAVLLDCTVSVVAREKARGQPQFNDTAMHRQNICPLHERYHNESLDLRNALDNFSMNVLIEVGNLFQYDYTIKTIKEYPGVIGELLDELAKRAGFTWRNSFYITTGPPSDKSYTDLIEWSTEHYDLHADWLVNSLERLKLGIGFPEGFYDASYILVGKKLEANSNKIYLFNWLDPFEWQVWLTIFATIVGSAILFIVLETANYTSGDKRSFSNSLFFSWLVFTQHFQFTPKSYAGRFFTASMAFWSLIISATYTANLASFFVVKNTPPDQINSIEEAIQVNMRICVADGLATAEYVDSNFKKSNSFVKTKNPESNMFAGILKGDCDLALISLQSWQQLENQENVNKGCQLTRIGRVVKFIDAGFGVKNDAGIKCTSLIHDVINVHLVEMKADGFIDKTWETHFKRIAETNCNIEKTSNDSAKLSLHDMAGTFFVHLLAGVLAGVFTILYRVRHNHMPNRTPREERNKNSIISVPVDKSKLDLTVGDVTGSSDVQNQFQELHYRLNDMENRHNEQHAELMSMVKDIAYETSENMRSSTVSLGIEEKGK